MPIVTIAAFTTSGFRVLELVRTVSRRTMMVVRLGCRSQLQQGLIAGVAV